jgi:hypothetical protein
LYCILDNHAAPSRLPLPRIVRDNAVFPRIANGEPTEDQVVMNDPFCWHSDADIRYVVHAANAYPKLIRTVRKFVSATTSPVM